MDACRRAKVERNESKNSAFFEALLSYCDQDQLKWLFPGRPHQLVQHLMRIKADDLGQIQELDYIDPALPVLHAGDQRLTLAQRLKVEPVAASTQYR